MFQIEGHLVQRPHIFSLLKKSDWVQKIKEERNWSPDVQWRVVRSGATGLGGSHRPWKGLLPLSKGSGKPQENFKQGNDTVRCTFQEDHAVHHEEEGPLGRKWQQGDPKGGCQGLPGQRPCGLEQGCERGWRDTGEGNM